MKTGCVCVSHAIREGFSSLIKMCEHLLLLLFVAWLSSDILRYFHRLLSFKIDCWQKFQMETIYLSRIFFLVHSLLFCYDHRNEHRKNNWNRNKRKWLQCDEHNDQLLKWAITALLLLLLVNREYRDNNWANICLSEKPIRKQQQAIIVNRFDGLLLSRRSPHTHTRICTRRCVNTFWDENELLRIIN